VVEIATQLFSFSELNPTPSVTCHKLEFEEAILQHERGGYNRGTETIKEDFDDLLLF
jgi:hypothetical protein